MNGWKWVPVEPTREMVLAACAKYGYPAGDSRVYAQGYRAMLAAAPPPAADAVTEAMAVIRAWSQPFSDKRDEVDAAWRTVDAALTTRGK